jgi:predicted RecA/RadA family phage recombinase
MNPQFGFVQQGDIIDITNTTDNPIRPGDPVPLAGAFGVATGNGIAPGATGPVVVRGVFLGPANPAVAYGQGDKLYWDPTNHWLTNNATDTVYAGYAVQAKSTGIGNGYVKLHF